MKPFSAKKLSILVLLIVLGLLSSPLGVIPARAAGILYVVPGGTGDCSSWANACTLQTALTGAVSGDEIWVAAGVYKPTIGNNRGATFQLKTGVAVYGGFAGTENIRDQRNFVDNETILSGDLLGNDSDNVEYDEPTRADNSYHVVMGANNAILDGFTITAGNATAYGASSGGGMYNLSHSPILTNVIFRHNSALDHGGGMANFTNSGPTLSKVKFDTNAVGGDGGGIYNDSSNPSLTDVTFIGNSAEPSGYGGGMFSNNYNSPTYPQLTNVTFSNNSAGSGGGMYNTSSNPSLTNITFIGNSAESAGGGIYNINHASPILINVTFSNNSAFVAGGGMSNTSGSSPIVMNTVFWGNTALIFEAQISNSGDSSSVAIVSDSIVQGGYPGGTNIITADPKLGTLGDYGGLTQTIPLLGGSSAIDAGSNTNCPAADQRGVTRPQGAGCDIGAYEVAVTFADVPATHWAWDWIERLYSAGITGGCGGGNYCPEEPVTRAQMAIFLLRGIHGSSYTPPLVGDSSGFSDVPVSYWASAWIKQFYAEGITGGCGSGVYCPDQSVTRAQMAIFLLRAKHGSSYSPPAADGSTGFGDVAADYWAAAWVKQLAAEGITGGCGNGNYCPEEPVTRAQMAVFLVRAFGLP